MKKKRIAFFDFACCEGCQLSVLQLDEKLLDLLDHVEVAAWREVMTGESDQYDVAFCEGSITRETDIHRIQNIRQTADIVVSLGSCASIGCHNALKNRWPTKKALEIVYGEQAKHFDSIPARPITAVVDVDYQVLGCPVSLTEFEAVFKCILTGQAYDPPNEPVCVECKRNDYLCVFEKGQICLGPVTRCGCNAICTAFGEPCHGCRGLLDQPNLEAAATVLTADHLHKIMDAVAHQYQLTREEVLDKFSLYNNWPELTFEEDDTHDT